MARQRATKSCDGKKKFGFPIHATAGSSRSEKNLIRSRWAPLHVDITNAYLLLGRGKYSTEVLVAVLLPRSLELLVGSRRHRQRQPQAVSQGLQQTQTAKASAGTRSEK